MKTANKIMMPNGELISLSGASFEMFDTILKDHILTYEQTKGWALQGTYVYKEAVAGSRYGYPDFYNKCVEEFENSDNSTTWLKNNVTQTGGTFTDKYIYTGASGAYLTVDGGVLPLSTADSWEFVTKYTYNGGGTNCIIFGGVEDIKIPKLQAMSNVLSLYVSSNGTSWDLISKKQGITLTTGTTYYIKLGFTGSEYYVDYKVDGTEEYTRTISVASTTKAHCSVNMALLNQASHSDTYYSNGSMDLSETYVTINGERWWSGTDYITKNPNGHLFYDISEKDKIDELYNTNGIAWYYGIDKENERIFLPRTKWFIQPSGEVTEVNTVNEAGLPNITGTVGSWQLGGDNCSGAFDYASYGSVSYGGSSSTEQKKGATFDASRCSAIYGNSDTIQPQSINQLLYICVGNTNVESAVTDVVDVTTTENDTMPLGYSTYQNGIVPNTSWLKSQGQWNDGNVYTTFYNEFVQKIGQQFASGYVKEITEEYDDYDLVINQDDMTFRLPLLDGSESVVDNSNITTICSDVTSYEYTVPRNGVIKHYQYWNTGTTGSKRVDLIINSVTYRINSNYGEGTFYNIPVKKGDVISFTSNDTTLTVTQYFTPFTGNGSLYFKVANAVQNLELLDAGEVLEAVNNVVPNNRELITGWSFPSNKHIDLTLGASGTTYTAPANGWVSILKTATGDQYIRLTSNYVSNQVFSGGSGRGISVSIPVSKGATVEISYNAGGATDYFRFIYAQGEV